MTSRLFGWALRLRRGRWSRWRPARTARPGRSRRLRWRRLRGGRPASLRVTSAIRIRWTCRRRPVGWSRISSLRTRLVLSMVGRTRRTVRRRGWVRGGVTSPATSSGPTGRVRMISFPRRPIPTPRVICVGGRTTRRWYGRAGRASWYGTPRRGRGGWPTMTAAALSCSRTGWIGTLRSMCCRRGISTATATRTLSPVTARTTWSCTG